MDPSTRSDALRRPFDRLRERLGMRAKGLRPAATIGVGKPGIAKCVSSLAYLKVDNEDDVTTCPFCEIAIRSGNAVIVWEDSDIVAFLDNRPIRRGHCLIIPRRHFESFDEVPADLVARIMELGQRLARKMKAIYEVERVAFLYAGSGVPHAHAHVFPMHEDMDVTSARYILNPGNPEFGSSHLSEDMESLLKVGSELRMD